MNHKLDPSGGNKERLAQKDTTMFNNKLSKKNIKIVADPPLDSKYFPYTSNYLLSFGSLGLVWEVQLYLLSFGIWIATVGPKQMDRYKIP